MIETDGAGRYKSMQCSKTAMMVQHHSSVSVQKYTVTIRVSVKKCTVTIRASAKKCTVTIRLFAKFKNRVNDCDDDTASHYCDCGEDDDGTRLHCLRISASKVKLKSSLRG